MVMRLSSLKSGTAWGWYLLALAAFGCRLDASGTNRDTGAGANAGTANLTQAGGESSAAGLYLGWGASVGGIAGNPAETNSAGHAAGAAIWYAIGGNHESGGVRNLAGAAAVIRGGSAQSAGAGNPTSGVSSQAGDANTAGDGNTSGGSPSAAACSTDQDCPDHARYCSATSGTCVGCRRGADCPIGSACENQSCLARTPCKSNAECPSSLPKCDISEGICVRCLADVDCPATSECVDNRCEAFVACDSSLDCPGFEVCSKVRGRCVGCVVDADCGAGLAQGCRSEQCRRICSADVDCDSTAPKCDVSIGACVGCLTHADCRSNEFCKLGSCATDRCESGDSRCTEDGIANCLADGDGFGSAAACPAGLVCTAELLRASCVVSAGGASGGTGTAGSAGAGYPDGSGGVGGASSIRNTAGTAGRGGGGRSGFGRGGSVSTAGAAASAGLAGTAGSGVNNCAALGANPCVSIPEFIGTQIVDGNDDDFCAIPGFELSFANATQVVQYNGRFDRSAYLERAIVRVAWSTNFVHAYARVYDPYVATADVLEYIWGADGIELMISANRVLSGSTANDASVLRIIAAPWVSSARGMAALVTTVGLVSSYSALPETSYAVVTYGDGYAVELQVPWPTGFVVTKGTQNAFDFALNAAEAGMDGGSNVRDAQAIYYQSADPRPSPCGTDVQPYCDDRTWCPTSLD